MNRLALRLPELRRRLDGLSAGAVRRAAFLEWTRAPHFPGQEPPRTAELEALDEALDAAGIHTSGDAELLLQLGLQRGRVAVLARGMARRARRALREFEGLLAWTERATRRRLASPGSVRLLEQRFMRLGRVLKVSDRFAGGEGGQFEVWSSTHARTAQPGSPRLEAAVFFADRARREWENVLQKRRDLEMAYVLLRTLGSETDRSFVWNLRREVQQGRTRSASALQTRSVPELLSLVRDPRGGERAYRGLRELYERCIEAGEATGAEWARRALDPLLPGNAALQSWAEGFIERQPAIAEHSLAELAFQLTPDLRATFELAASCARYFDIEEDLAEERGWAPTRADPTRVPFPAEEMTLETTGRPEDVRDFVLGDPRLMWVDLAAHRQLARAYWKTTSPTTTARRSAVRLYLCDASGSMQGTRARFRDAVLLAELNNLRVRAKLGQSFDPLYFCFFNDQPTELVRVDSGREAVNQIQLLFSKSLARGQTDITGALQFAFESIRAARGRDSHLERAKVVLVTDGEDRIRLEEVREARSRVGELRIALSFISLGEENGDLRSLADEQRAAGERAFYYHLTDYEVGAVRTDFDRGFRTLLPAEARLDPAMLTTLEPQLQALESLAAARPPPATRPSAASFDAFFPIVAPAIELAPTPADVERVRDILSVVAEIAPLSMAEHRAQDAVALLLHLLKVFEMGLPAYLAALGAAASGSEASAVRSRESLERLRILSRPLC